MYSVFDKYLQNYILKVTSPENPLLENLRKETENVFGMAHWLTGPVEGKFLQILVKISNAKKCLEIGTFTGYSALNIASGLPQDGKLITCEISQNHADFAKKYLDKSAHGRKIEIRVGEAIKTIPTLDNDFDFIFIDGDKENYGVYYDMLIPKLRSGGIMAVDNALWHGEVVAHVDAQSKAIHSLNVKAYEDVCVETVMLSVRDGIMLIRKLETTNIEHKQLPF
jgi:caffeoyl-CoA O-methyltransferase